MAARVLHFSNFIRDPAVLAAKKIAAGNHHINLVRPFSHRVAGVLQFHCQRVHAARKGRGHRRHLDRRPLERLTGDSDHGGINTNGGDQGHVWAG